MTSLPARLGIILLASIVLALASPAAEAGADAPPPDESLFASPPLDFRPVAINHSGILRNPKALNALKALRSGGIVVDAGITPGSKNQGLKGEVHTNPTYMNDPEQFERLRHLMKAVREQKGQIWIYDELAYPSASAGGLVIDGHPEYAPEVIGCRILRPDSTAKIAIKQAQGTIHACYALPLVHGSYDLKQAVDLTSKAKEGLEWTAPGKEWAVFVLDHYYPDTWKRHNIYRRNVNIMNREAIARFIEVTHERYAKELGPQLADVFAFFTDEPQLGSVENWSAGLKECEPMAPWCPDFAAIFQAKKGYDVTPILPALFADVGPKTAKYRYDYYDVQSDIVAEHYFKPIEEWCHAHGTLSSGHFLLEESILLHLMFTGSMMKCWAHTDLPGVDLLLGAPYKTMPGWEAGHFNVPEDYSNKMASSVAHLRGKEGVFTESFALAKISERAAKGVAAWQFARGVTHMTTYTIQNHLPKEQYAALSDFVGRMAMWVRRGSHVADVAVLVPEPSIWASYTPPDGGRFARYMDCNPEPVRIDQTFRGCCFRLSQAQRDFDCMDEGMLLDAACRDGRLHLADESFAFLVVPEGRMMRADIAAKIEAFVKQGGHVIFVGELPKKTPAEGVSPAMEKRIKALLKDNPAQVRHTANAKAFAQTLGWMADRVPPVLTWDGLPRVRILHRKEGDRHIFLLANPGKADAPGVFRTEAAGSASVWDPETGCVHPLGAKAAQADISVKLPAESARILVIEGL